MNKLHRQDKGFTIIEVVLVLAIAALIFLMVFVALPALQASQRDTARKNDASSVAASAQSYMSSERTSLKNGDTSKLKKYINDLDQYEDGNVSVVAGVGSAGGQDVSVGKEQIKIFVASKCAGTQVKKGVSRSAAVVIKLESGGNEGSNYCVDI